ncbi:unnamed protein product [Darwinula stevensoni]|uniref:Uncharacterized protein n=1 Tax=Darwinula stevensoni TaxID=69355 RepID=A0A7R8X001_9CRUS|nr:unnamed protein product [Darwinula stevensoni]CAG0878481.1 unnamed protein product [Darwinula stevensoni]
MNLVNDPLHDKKSEEEDEDDFNNHDGFHRAAPNEEAAGDQSDNPEELEELTALDSQLNQLHSALDELEKQHDSVHTRVKELLESTRAMRADAERQECACVGNESCMHVADDTPIDRHSNGCDPC